METKKPLEVAHESLEAFNRRNWKEFGALLAPNAVYDEVGTGRKLTGRDEIVDAIRGWTEAFSDVEGLIDNEVVADDAIAIEVTYEGTHDGELSIPGTIVPASGETCITRCAQIIRVEDGLIVENRNFFDVMGMLRAVGAIPAAAAKKAGA